MPRSTEDDTQPDAARPASTDPGLAPPAADADRVRRRETALGLGASRPDRSEAPDASSDPVSGIAGDVSNPNPVPVEDLLSALGKKQNVLPPIHARQTSGERAAAYDAPAIAPPPGHDTAPPESSIVLDIPTDPSRGPTTDASRYAPTVVTRPRQRLPWWTVPATLAVVIGLALVGWAMFRGDSATPAQVSSAASTVRASAGTIGPAASEAPPERTGVSATTPAPPIAAASSAPAPIAAAPNAASPQPQRAAPPAAASSTATPSPPPPPPKSPRTIHEPL